MNFTCCPLLLSGLVLAHFSGDRLLPCLFVLYLSLCLHHACFCDWVGLCLWLSCFCLSTTPGALCLVVLWLFQSMSLGRSCASLPTVPAIVLSFFPCLSLAVPQAPTAKPSGEQTRKHATHTCPGRGKSFPRNTPTCVREAPLRSHQGFTRFFRSSTADVPM